MKSLIHLSLNVLNSVENEKPLVDCPTVNGNHNTNKPPELPTYTSRFYETLAAESVYEQDLLKKMFYSTAQEFGSHVKLFGSIPHCSHIKWYEWGNSPNISEVLFRTFNLPCSLRAQWMVMTKFRQRKNYFYCRFDHDFFKFRNSKFFGSVWLDVEYSHGYYRVSGSSLPTTRIRHDQIRKMSVSKKCDCIEIPYNACDRIFILVDHCLLTDQKTKRPLADEVSRDKDFQYHASEKKYLP